MPKMRLLKNCLIFLFIFFSHLPLHAESYVDASIFGRVSESWVNEKNISENERRFRMRARSDGIWYANFMNGKPKKIAGELSAEAQLADKIMQIHLHNKNGAWNLINVFRRDEVPIDLRSRSMLPLAELLLSSIKDKNSSSATSYNFQINAQNPLIDLQKQKLELQREIFQHQKNLDAKYENDRLLKSVQPVDPIEINILRGPFDRETIGGSGVDSRIK